MAHEMGRAYLLTAPLAWRGIRAQVQREADAATARTMVEHVIRYNDLAVIWNRVLLVAASRVDDIRDLLWPIATREPFLLSADTTKDAIDFVAARYPMEQHSAREAFEKDALGFDFSFSSEPERSRKRHLETLFGCIGATNLATAEARAFLPSDQSASAASARNHRPFAMTGWTKSSSPHWWFDEKVNVKAPENAPLLAEADRVKAALGMGETNNPITDVGGAIRQLESLRAMAEVSAAADEIKEYAVGVISQAVQKIGGLKASQLRAAGHAVSGLVASIDYLAMLPWLNWRRK